MSKDYSKAPRYTPPPAVIRQVQRELTYKPYNSLAVAAKMHDANVLVPPGTPAKPTTPTTNPNGNINEIIDVLDASGNELYDITTGLLL